MHLTVAHVFEYDSSHTNTSKYARAHTLRKTHLDILQVGRIPVRVLLGAVTKNVAGKMFPLHWTPRRFLILTL